MTMPNIQFPTINPGQPIMDPGTGAQVADTLAGVLKAMQDKQKLEQERQEFESKQQYFKTLDEGNALDNQKKRDEIKAGQRALDTKTQGLNAYSQWVGSGAKQEDLGKILAPIKDPDVSQDVLNRVTAHFKEQGEAAQARQAASQAAVSEATQGDQITEGKAKAQKAEADATVATSTESDQVRDAKASRQLHETQAKAAIAAANAPPVPDPQAINAMTTLYRSGGMTLGDAAKQSGVPLPAGVNPDQKFEVQTRGMAQYKANAKASAVPALLANSQIEQLLSTGVKVGKLTPFKKMLPGQVANSMIPEAEQGLMSAAGQFASQYILAISGRAATDQERNQAMDQMVPRSGDKPLVVKQKELMRSAMVQTMLDAAQGASRPMSQIIGSVIGAAKAKGLSGETLKFLQKSQMDAATAESLYGKMDSNDPADIPPLTAGPDPATPDSVSAFLGSYGR